MVYRWIFLNVFVLRFLPTKWQMVCDIFQQNNVIQGCWLIKWIGLFVPGWGFCVACDCWASKPGEPRRFGIWWDDCCCCCCCFWCWCTCWLVGQLFKAANVWANCSFEFTCWLTGIVKMVCVEIPFRISKQQQQHLIDEIQCDLFIECITSHSIVLTLGRWY